MALPSDRHVEDPRYLLIGEITRPHGVVGEVRMRVRTAYPERLLELKRVHIGRDLDDPAVIEYPVAGVRLHQNYALLKLAGIDNRDQADRLRQLQVMVALEDAVPLEDGEHYLYQIIGLRVETETGDVLGPLTEVLETGANDVYIVDSPQYGEVLIPATDETILDTDIQAGRMVVKLPDGLLPGA
jgi:16S rRNA processing protein RimM